AGGAHAGRGRAGDEASRAADGADEHAGIDRAGEVGTSGRGRPHLTAAGAVPVSRTSWCAILAPNVGRCYVPGPVVRLAGTRWYHLLAPNDHRRQPVRLLAPDRARRRPRP